VREIPRRSNHHNKRDIHGSPAQRPAGAVQGEPPLVAVMADAGTAARRSQTRSVRERPHPRQQNVGYGGVLASVCRGRGRAPTTFAAQRMPETPPPARADKASARSSAAFSGAASPRAMRAYA